MQGILFSFLSEYGPLFLEGLVTTLILAFVGTIVGFFLGLFLALARNIKKNPTDTKMKILLKSSGYILSTIYVQFFRGTPMMVQAIILFFGSSAVGFSWDPLVCGLVVISLNTAAYMAEIIKSGINAIDPGQIEAARSLGMSHFQAMNCVIFPQAIKNSIPSIGNELIVNIKDSSVLNVIMITELFYAAQTAYTDTYNIIASYGTVCIIYLILTLGVAQILKLIEKRFQVGHLKKIKRGNIHG